MASDKKDWDFWWNWDWPWESEFWDFYSPQSVSGNPITQGPYDAPNIYDISEEVSDATGLPSLKEIKQGSWLLIVGGAILIYSMVTK